MKKVILYGAGDVAAKAYAFLKYLELEDAVSCFCVSQASRGERRLEKPILPYTEAKNYGIPFIISVQKRSNAFKEIKKILIKDGVHFYESLRDWAASANMDMGWWERELIAFAHIDNPYFQDAEREDELDVFWKGAFYRLFSQLDLSNVVELAAGHGRHVPKYIEKAGTVTLVDVLHDNIEFCKKRFAGRNNIVYYNNDGKSLSGLSDSYYSALFSYDAMVHFDMMDINAYLAETRRVLRKGGKALFHHSNNHINYRVTFESGASNRNYMSMELFAHLAYMNGLEIIEQIVFDWNGVKDLDCLTLVQRNIV